MKRLIILFFLCAGIARAQSTTVSATITDASGQAWKQGTYTFTFRPAPSNPTGTYYWNGVPLTGDQKTIAGHMDTSGHFSVSVPSNTSITPSQSTWDLQVCPIALGNSPCFTQQSITISGPTQDLSSIHPPAISIDLAHPAYPFVVAYTNAEITTAPLGGIYYDYTTVHYWICEAISPTGQVQNYGTCSLWVEICQVGDGLCGGGGVNATYLHNGVVVGQEPRFNLIDGTNMTLTLVDNPGATRVDATFASSGGGGTGCTLPVGGLTFGVLEENPKGTCFDDINFTWDPTLPVATTTNGRIMLIGNASNTVQAAGAGKSFDYIFEFGHDNSVVSSAVTGEHSEAIQIGAGNTFDNCATCFALGDSNDSTSSIVYSIGTHDDLHGINLYAIGSHHGINNNVAGPGDAEEIRLIGEFGLVSLLGPDTLALDIDLIGEADNVEVGEPASNLFQNQANCIHGIGGNNTLTIDGGLSADAGISTLSWVGKNSSYEAHGFFIENMVTAGNNMTVLANSQNVNHAGLYGYHMLLQNCHDCFGVGENVQLTGTLNNVLALGVSVAPEVVITPASVNVTAWPVSKIVAFTFCAAGCTLTGTPCTTGSSSYDQCASPNAINFSSLFTFADANYIASCRGVGPEDPLNPGQPGRVGEPMILSKTTTTITVTPVTLGSTAIHWDSYDCSLIHR